MNDYIKPLSLTITDFLGIFIPGLIFLTQIILLQEVIFNHNIPSDSNPIIIVISFITNLNQNQVVAWIVFTFLGILMGYVFKPYVMTYAENISLFFSYEVLFKRRKKKLEYYRFPFTQMIGKKPYFKLVKSIIEKTCKLNYNDIPRKNPYSYCKRYLKLHSPSLWEECEHLEGEVRILGSLFLSSIVNMLICVLSILLGILSSSIHLQWLLVSLFFVLILGIGLRYRRRKEVEYTYLLMIVLNADRISNIGTINNIKN